MVVWCYLLTSSRALRGAGPLVNRLRRTSPRIVSPVFSSSSFSSDVSSEKKKLVLVAIADGSEEIETSCISDTLVRAGAAVTIASANADGSTTVTMSRGLRILADAHVDALQVTDWDLVAIPGGMPGASNLANSTTLKDILLAQQKAKRPLGAVCAAPAVVFEPLGLLAGKSATCYPAFQPALGDSLRLEDVVVDENIVTSQGPGTSLKFALALVRQLYGETMQHQIAQQMLVDLHSEK